MAAKIIVGLIALLAIIQGLMGEAGHEIVPLILVILGLAYAAVAVNAEDATAYLVVTLAVGGAAGMDVLSNIPGFGASLDAILDQVTTALYAGVVTVLVLRTINCLKA